MENEENEPVEAINLVRPQRDGQRSPYYVSEADLYAGVLQLYETGEFPEALAADLLKMCQRIITSRRFHDYSDTLKEEAVSSASVKVCQMLMKHKYDPYRGSKVYSWATRVILNEMLQVLRREDVEKKKWQKLTEDVAANGGFEVKERS